MKKPDALQELRQRIDSLDEHILTLLNARAEAAIAIGAVKAEQGQRAYAPERERAVVARLSKLSSGPIDATSIRRIYSEIMSASRALESPLEVAYLGPPATFTHQAAQKHFGASASLRACGTVEDVFEEVERERVSFGVVPVENSTEGTVHSTLDRFTQSDVTISAEVSVPVQLHLLTKSGTMRGVKRVVSHPQALAQCRGWLARHLAHMPQEESTSTAAAAALARKDGRVAAVAGEIAARAYDLGVAERHVADLRHNVTRFVVLGRDTPPPTGNDRTSVWFALRDSPGALSDALLPFAKARINMSRIESRPSRKRAWDYVFFVDLDGHRDEPEVAKALKTLERACAVVKVLGSYAKGEV